MSSANDVAATIAKAKGADGEDAIPFMGAFCCFEACYLTWPDTLGCAGKTSCLCYHTEFLSCKLPNPEKEEDKDLWFVCNRGNSVLAQPKNCCSQRSQCFCLDVRGSIPPTEEIPCLCTICFFTIMYKNKMVNTFMGDIKTLEEKAAALP